MKERKLADLAGIGRAMLRDFELLGVNSVEQLAKQDATVLYKKMCRISGTRQDPCVWDTYACAIAQARNSKLPAKECKWWTWSTIRKKRGILL